jgi:outer membrane protein OmpA-like peptidoglycan-associated protein/predicted Ser/Thr protein kinase
MAGTLLAEGTAVGRYRIRHLLGAGGMGEVYLAWDSSLDRLVALKILPRDLMRDPTRVQRFVTEAKAASALNHPAIVTIYETGEEALGGDPLHYIAMERIEGVTFDEWLRQEPPLASILTQLAQVAEALGKAHARGIVHRDVKPDNIMITAEGRAKVLDFGVAKLVGVEPRGEDLRSPSGRRTLTGSSTLLGTAGYMSPEQIEGFALDHRADIFSFGCILYESITGRSAFLGSTNAETLHNIVHRNPPPIALANRKLSDSLGRIIDRCIAKDREQRYDSARDLSADLLQSAAITALARPGGLVNRASRSRLLRGAAALAMLLLAGLILRVPAGAIVETVTAAVSPSNHPRVQRLERLLAAERAQNQSASAALTEREREIARRGIEIERLRAEREQGERFRTDLESSYRKLLADVSEDLGRNKAERSQLRERVAGAETELKRFRDEQQRRTTQRERLAAIQTELSAVADASIEARGVVLTIPGALFGSGRSSMAREGGAILQAIVTQVVANPDLKVVIEGHTDDNGDSDGNLELSRERADGIRDHLVTGGVDPARITTIGRGEGFPIASNEYYEGRVQNRRVAMLLAF